MRNNFVRKDKIFVPKVALDCSRTEGGKKDKTTFKEFVKAGHRSFVKSKS